MRVLMGDFAALYRLGLRDILSGDAVQVIEAESGRLIELLVEVLPQVVVLDGDKEETGSTVARIVRDFPAIRVIACSSQTPTMRVFPSFHSGESYSTPLDPASLKQEVLV